MNKTGVYNSVDLKRAIKYGYKITKIHKAISWEHQANIFDSYIENVFQKKCNALKKTPQYTTSKLLMNSLYGKFLQRPHVEQSVVIETAKQLAKIRKNNHIMEVKPLNENKFIVSYIPNDKDKAVEKPSYIGSFILAYSREIMDGYNLTLND